jgi:glyoxylase I family protein
VKRLHEEGGGMIRNIHHFGILVKDYEAMVKFYQEAFGFETAGTELDLDKLQASRISGPTPGPRRRIIMMKAGNCFLEIMEDPAPDNGANGQRPSRGYVQMCVEVDDIDAEYARLKQLGVNFGQAAPVEFGYLKAVTGRDPEGNIIELEQMLTDWDCNLPKLLAGSEA